MRRFSIKGCVKILIIFKNPSVLLKSGKKETYAVKGILWAKLSVWDFDSRKNSQVNSNLFLYIPHPFML